MSAMGSVAQAPRRYRGLTAAERHAQRRGRLLDVGLEVFGTSGYASSSVRSISAAAGLNSRYFHESFSSKEELLRVVYERINSGDSVAVRKETARQDTIDCTPTGSRRAPGVVVLVLTSVL
jgi:AcrR family transcriptional regulator